MKEEKVSQRRSVKYNFTADELLEMSSELAHRNQEIRQLEEQKKSVVSDFASRINVVKEMISQISDKIAGGSEMREMEFTVDYHQPERNLKTLTNEETGLVRVEKMVLADFDLFSQFMGDSVEHVTTDDHVVYNSDEDDEAEMQMEAQLEQEYEQQAEVEFSAKDSKAGKRKNKAKVEVDDLPL